MQGHDLPSRDPVCGNLVDHPDTRLQTEYADNAYTFCSQRCMDRFLEQPDIFTIRPGLGELAESDRAQRDDEHGGELQPAKPARLDSSVPAADPGS